MNICVCDDDIAFARALSQKIRLYAAHLPEEYNIDVQSFFSADTVLDYVRKIPVDILFLDIDMPHKTGFDLARDLTHCSPDTQIIFVSSYDNLVYNSFEFNPFYFLRKSHMAAELESVFERAIQKLQKIQQMISVKTPEGPALLKIRDVLYIESESNYYAVHCRGGSVCKCRGTLSAVEEILRQYGIVRVHSAFLVNPEHILSVGQNRNLLLSDGTRISVSARKWPDFKNAYAEYSRRRKA